MLSRTAVFAVVVAFATEAAAQEQTSRILLPAPSILLTDDASAILENPGNLALLSSWSLFYLHAQAIGQTEIAGNGDALLFALPIFDGLALGTGLEVLRPTIALARPRATGIFSFAVGRRSLVGLGFTYRGFVSDGDGIIDARREWSAGLTLRPASFYSLAATVHDLNTPLVGTFAVPAPLPATRIWTFGVGVRPTSRDVLSVLGEIDVAEDARPNVPRVVVEAAVPWVGTARVSVERALRPDGGREIRGDVALEVHAGHVAAGGGIVGGTRDPDTNRTSLRAWTVSLETSGDRMRGIPRPARVRKIQIDSDLDVRGLAAFTRRLEADALDPSVDGVLIVPRGAIGGLAAASEIGRRIDGLRRRGRKVACHLEEGSGSQLAACAGADRIWVAPAGGIRLVGVRDEALFFRDLLSKIGVRAQIVRVGDYKSAPEALMRMSSTDPAIEEREAMLDDEYADLVGRIARGRRLSPERVRELIDEGPYTAPAAVRAGLADGLAHEDDLDRHLTKLFGHRVLVEGDEDAPERPRRWAQAPAVAVVYVEDDIVDGESFDVPLLGSHFTGAETIVKTLEDLRGDARVGAIVLRIDSPGGSATASERIWRAVKRTTKVKPVIASMGSMAASGGYYAACAADAIFAEPTTLTGSIGIFYGKADVEALFRDVGIGVELAGRGRRAHMESTFRPYTDDELTFLQEHIHDFYGIFVRRVATGRHKTFDEIDRVGQGRVWSGRRAKDVGLVDRFGGLTEAIREAKSRAGLPWDAAVLERPERGGGLVDLLVGALVREREPVPRAPAALARMARALGPFAYLDPRAPQARLPWVRLSDEP